MSILLDECDVGGGPQGLQVNMGEGSSETVDDVPFVCDVGLAGNLVGEGGDAGSTISTVVEGHNISPRNWVLVPLDRDKGRGGSESWEDAENDKDELL